MTDIDVHLARDPERYLATDLLVWAAETYRSVGTEDLLLGVPADQRFAADVPDGPATCHAGIYGVRPGELAVPAGPGAAMVPCAGLTWVGVHPDHRRSGVLTAMLRDHFERTRDAGLPLSALHASEPAIYGRFGYGLATLELEVTLSRGTTFTAPGLEEAAASVRTETTTITDPGMAERLRACDRYVAERQPGQLWLGEDFYQRVCTEVEEESRGKEPPRVLFARVDGRDVGNAAYRRTHKWENARPGGEVEVLSLHGEPAVRLALLRRLVDLDLMGTVKVTKVAEDDPLLAWVGGPRATGDVKTYDNVWIRLVELESAWSARSYQRPCDVVVEVEDAHAPWNAGRWRLVAEPSGTGSAERTDADADVRLDVRVLGAGHLGGNVASLLPAGLVTEQRPGAFGELAAAMRTELLPFPAVGF